MNAPLSTDQYIDIVFDGPPGHDGPKFVEVEDAQGRSMRYGDWVQRPDGYWVLRIPRVLAPDPIGDKLRSLPVIGVLNVDDPHDPRHKKWKL